MDEYVYRRWTKTCNLAKDKNKYMITELKNGDVKIAIPIMVGFFGYSTVVGGSNLKAEWEIKFLNVKKLYIIDKMTSLHRLLL